MAVGRQAKHLSLPKICLGTRWALVIHLGGVQGARPLLRPACVCSFKVAPHAVILSTNSETGPGPRASTTAPSGTSAPVSMWSISQSSISTGQRRPDPISRLSIPASPSLASPSSCCDCVGHNVEPFDVDDFRPASPDRARCGQTSSSDRLGCSPRLNLGWKSTGSLQGFSPRSSLLGTDVHERDDWCPYPT